MHLSNFQDACINTAIYRQTLSKDWWLGYVTLGLAGECGEVCNKIKKIYRDKNGNINNDDRAAISNEIGDTLWYIGMICNELGIDLNEVAVANLMKLEKRKTAGTIQGSGDER